LDTLELDALVLAGGESRRMGRPKALLPFGDTTLLGAVVKRLRPLFHRVLVVARENESLRGVDAEVLIDDRLERGPLVGLARGLAATEAPCCFVVGCDMPFIQPKVIKHMARLLDGCDVLAPLIGGRVQPLHAFYSRRCLSLATQLLDANSVSLQALLALCQVRTIGADELVPLDPELLSFRDVDTVKDYAKAKALVNLTER
jgi:molybdopterin-guanine dinucleotide biosynthesis protein A